MTKQTKSYRGEKKKIPSDYFSTSFHRAALLGQPPAAPTGWRTESSSHMFTNQT